ncbi:hypothetical protein LCGC14_2567280 [marine sediment metagenome]|uniref:Uncharacterized protein n=1 Tax=marine sediment metagenome TaxID=412755 RepID=A0A0F9DB75_9ZZZZ
MNRQYQQYPYREHFLNDRSVPTETRKLVQLHTNGSITLLSWKPRSKNNMEAYVYLSHKQAKRLYRFLETAFKVKLTNEKKES